MEYEETVYTGRLATAAVLVQNRRLLADWILDRKLFEAPPASRPPACRPCQRAGRRPPAQTLHAMLVATSNEMLTKELGKVNGQAGEILARVREQRKDLRVRELEKPFSLISCCTRAAFGVPGTVRRRPERAGQSRNPAVAAK